MPVIDVPAVFSVIVPLAEAEQALNGVGMLVAGIVIVNVIVVPDTVPLIVGVA